MAVLGLLSCGAGHATDDVPAFSAGLGIAATLQAGDAGPLREGEFAGGVRAITDVPYVPSAGASQRLDLYLPPHIADGRAAPLLVFIHGGGWSAGHPRALGTFADFPQVLARFAARGYAVASLGYRRSGEAPFPAALEDIHAALAWLRADAGFYAIDPNRIALWGASAGAHLAALAALNGGQSLGVKALVGWYGIYDLQRLQATPGYPAIVEASGQWLGCAPARCTVQQLAAASPIAYLAAPLPPTLLIYGDADRVVPPEQSQLFAQHLAAQGARVTLLQAPGLGHSLVGGDQAATAAGNRAALEATLRFLDRAL